MITDPQAAIEIFICYAREDEKHRANLEKQLQVLKRQHLIDVWNDRMINPGKNWQREIDNHLNSADIILLLVSSDFMISDYCYGIEMKRAMERYERGEAQLVPIIVRPVYWQKAPFGGLQALPTDAKPVTDSFWHTPDHAFFNVAEGIREVIEKIQEERLRKAEEERARIAEEERRRIEKIQQEERRLIAEQERSRKAEEERRRIEKIQQEERRRKAIEERLRIAEQERSRTLEEERTRTAEQERLRKTLIESSPVAPTALEALENPLPANKSPEKLMRQADGSDLLGANDARNASIGIIYVAPGDDRPSVLEAILMQDKLGRIQVAVVLPENNRAFQRPVDFDGLKNMRRGLKTEIIFVIPGEPGPAEFARQRRFTVYTSLDSYKAALQAESSDNGHGERGLPLFNRRPKLVPNANAPAPLESFDEPASPLPIPLVAPIVPMSAPPPIAAVPFDDDEDIKWDEPAPIEPFLAPGGADVVDSSLVAGDERLKPSPQQDAGPYVAPVVPFPEDEDERPVRPRFKTGPLPIPIPIALPQTGAATKPLAPGARSGNTGKQAAVGAGAVGVGAAAAFAATNRPPVIGGGQPPIRGNASGSGSGGGGGRSRRRSTRQLLAILLVILTLLLLVGIAFASPPGQGLIGNITGSTLTAIVTITPNHQKVSDSHVVNAVIGTPDLAVHQVQARILTYLSPPLSASANATGSNGSKPVITQNDNTTASNLLINAARQSAQTDLQPQVKSGEQAVSNQPMCAANNPTSNQHVGQQTPQITVMGTVTCTEEVYDQKGALGIATTALKAEAAKNPGAGFALVGNVLTSITSVAVVDAKNTISLVILAQGEWVHQFKDAILTGIKNTIAKGSRSSAQADLMKTSGVLYATISLFSATNMPDAANIRIKVLPIPGLTGSPTPGSGSPTSSPAITPTTGLGNVPSVTPTPTFTPHGS